MLIYSMEHYMGKCAPYVYVMLRIIAGLMFAAHGAQKVFGMFGNPHPGISLASMMGIGGIIELVGGVLIAFGFLASYAAFIASGEMAVAYFMVHFPKSFFPIVNKGELAVLFCFVFLYIAVHGSGAWSIDHLIKPSPKNKK